MDLQSQLTEAITAELERQAGDQLKVGRERDGAIRVEGVIDLEALAMVVAGAVAGGP